MNVLSVLILVVLEGTVLLAAFFYDPQIFAETASLFRLTWVMVLVLANWAASTLIFFKNRNVTKSPDFGAVPAINITVFLWSILSIMAMLLMADISLNIHLMIQVILAGAMLFLVLSMLLGSAAAKTDGAAPTISKKDLASLIKQLEDNNADQSDFFKTLREQVLNSLPHDHKLAQSDAYNELVIKIQSLSETGLKPDDQEIKKLKDIIKICAA